MLTCPKNSNTEVLPSCFLLEAELHNFCYNSRYAYEMVVNFGENNLHNITHKVGIQHKTEL
jgi:hypothetical protein